MGLVHGVLAYGTWGLFPLYFKQVAHVQPIQVLCHRIFWSLLVVGAIVSVQRRWSDVRAVLGSRKTMLTLVGSTLLIASNWFLFIYAVSAGKVLQSSLGYYINPLVSVLLGIVVLRERLRPMQAVGLALAALGVVNLTWTLGHFPWLAIGLALTFGFYGLLRKTVAAGPLVGLCVETGLLMPLAIFMLGRNLPHAAQTYSLATWGWLVAAGPITAIPLLWFANAARRLRLATIGFIQYLTPTGQFLLAVAMYHEPFTRAHAITFALIWTALLIYSLDYVYRDRAARKGEEPAAAASGTAG